MSDPLLIYGATGYTGKLILSEFVQLGIRPVLGGRNASKLAELAEPLGLQHRVVALQDAARLDALLGEVDLVLHAAGPFSATARPMVDACLRTGRHYLDISAEVRVIEALAASDAAARQRNIMIMPAVGFDVVPSDCLAVHVARRVPGARRLALALSGLQFMTRGSAKTLVEAVDCAVVRRDGAITPVQFGSLQRSFDFGNGARVCLNVSWGDVATAYYSTGIPNIETYSEASPLLRNVLTSCRYFGWVLRAPAWQLWLKTQMDRLPEGPSDAERAAAHVVIVAEATDAAGRRAVARLRTPEAYSFTASTAAEIARRVLRGDLENGFQTPGRVYGADFPLTFARVSREDIE